MVTLHKVEGHSDDYWNNKADELANGGSQIKDPIIVNHKFFQRKSLGFISWNNIYIIDRNGRIRPFNLSSLTR